MKEISLALVFFLIGCSSLVTEQRMAKLDTEVRAIQHDFQTFSATFTPEQRENYARAKVAQDDPTFHEFSASLNPGQQATMTTLLNRSNQVEEDRQAVLSTISQDLTSRKYTRRLAAQVRGGTVGGVP
jgi:hypothetical protein